MGELAGSGNDVLPGGRATLTDFKYLPWFLGPKAENAQFMEEMLLYLARDYTHWRRNYFPGDKPLLTKIDQRQSVDVYDHFESKLSELSALLRRNFPFYNPRYVAHQLSEVSLPYFLGAFAGMLYNPNNVTPEAAPVTVELEIEACAKVLEMLGYSPAPAPPKTKDDQSDYEKRLKGEFGWAHITSGGTAANIEALWVARAVKYFPLAAKDAAAKLGVSVLVKLPDGKARDIRRIDYRRLCHIKPNESIYLLGRLIESVQQSRVTTTAKAAELTLEALSDGKYSATRGFYEAAAKFPPVIFASGAAHYSVQKAANVLGIGSANVVMVDMDSMFRLDVDDLRQKIDIALSHGRVPLAVISIAGTTEEGAVDPLHEILDLRKNYEVDKAVSFWVHVDAAWGGFFRTLFRPPVKEVVRTVLERVGEALGVAFTGDISEWHNRVFLDFGKDNEKRAQFLDWLLSRYRASAPEDYFRTLYSALKKHRRASGADALRALDFKITVKDRLRIVQEYAADRIALDYGTYLREIDLAYGHEGLCSSFLAFPLADSITVDPHKMGYAGYPCGLVAFKNDRVRHFIMHRAPYITTRALDNDVLVHQPPQHLDSFDYLEPKISVDAFAPFILEGSRPGAAATGLWLMTQVVPLDMEGHGEIVRSTLIAARELREWLQHWDKISHANDVDNYFAFIDFLEFAPDTNIVIFAVHRKVSGSLVELNQLTDAVYQRFSIQSELGEREFSYAQPFFLSKTRFEEPYYKFGSLERFFARAGIRDPKSEYSKHGVSVLRATVMNPFIAPLRKRKVQNLLLEFIEELARAAADAVRTLV